MYAFALHAKMCRVKPGSLNILYLLPLCKIYMHVAMRESKESGEMPAGIYGAFSPLSVTVALLFMHTMCYLGSPVSGDWSKAAVNFGVLLYQLK